MEIEKKNKDLLSLLQKIKVNMKHKLQNTNYNKYTIKLQNRIQYKISKTKHVKHVKHDKHDKHTKPTTYIQKLINLYYNNDNVSRDYIKNAMSRQHIFPTQKRVIVIGDIHGDFDAAISCLLLAKCISPIKVPTNKNVLTMNEFFNKLQWIGNDTHIVQLGDQLDRVRPQNWDNNNVTRDSAFLDEGSTLEIFYLFYHLNNLAIQSGKGGRVFSVIGNHEIMNVEGDFRYVSLKEFKSFKNHLSTTYHSNSKFPYHSKTLKQNSRILHSSNSHYSKLPDGYKERLYAFSPTGLCANYMGYNSYTILQIGSWLFCHGSPVLSIVKTHNAEMINNIVSMYMLGIDTNTNDIEKQYDLIAKSKDNKNGDGNESILWDRTFGEEKVSKKQDIKLAHKLVGILSAYNSKNSLDSKHSIINSNTPTPTPTPTPMPIPAKYIAIGHTIQDSGINSICNNKVWRTDIAMSRAFIDKTDTTDKNDTNDTNDTNNNSIITPPTLRYQVLEILDNDKIKILS
jgi:hypothetical protein